MGCGDAAGTYAGVQRHRSRGEDPCAECLAARKARQRERSRQRVRVKRATKPRDPAPPPVLPRTDWLERANCRDLDPGWWTDPADAETVAVAVAVCRRCPVTAQCAELAAALGVSDGQVWAGRRQWKGTA